MSIAKRPPKSLRPDGWNGPTRTVPEVLGHIRRIEGCTIATAKRKLRTALRDGIGPLYWEGAFPGDSPPRGDPRWMTVKFNWKTSSVSDFSASAGSESRPLLLFHDAVEQWWPDLQARKEADERSSAAAIEAAKRDYEAVYWPKERALNWITWRDQLRINESWRLGLFYKSKNEGFRGDPRPKLVRALQENLLARSKMGDGARRVG